MKEKTVEELIDIASQEETDDSYIKMNDVQNFFIEINLEPTPDDKVDSQNIYWVYQKWCLNNKIPYVTRSVFFKEINKKCKVTYSRGTTFVYVKSEPFNLTQDEWFVMRRAYRREVNDAIRKKNAKKRKNKKK